MTAEGTPRTWTLLQWQEGRYQDLGRTFTGDDVLDVRATIDHPFPIPYRDETVEVIEKGPVLDLLERAHLLRGAYGGVEHATVMEQIATLLRAHGRPKGAGDDR